MSSPGYLKDVPAWMWVAAILAPVALLLNSIMISSMTLSMNTSVYQTIDLTIGSMVPFLRQRWLFFALVSIYMASVYILASNSGLVESQVSWYLFTLGLVLGSYTVIIVGFVEPLKPKKVKNEEFFFNLSIFFWFLLMYIVLFVHQLDINRNPDTFDIIGYCLISFLALPMILFFVWVGIRKKKDKKREAHNLIASVDIFLLFLFIIWTFWLSAFGIESTIHDR